MKKILLKGGFIVLMAALALMTGCLSYSVDSVEVNIDGNATSIDAGQTIQFKAYVNASGKDTSGAQRVKWSVSSTSDGRGEVTRGTTVSPSGMLSVSADEIYPVLYVRATHDSFAYSGKYDFKQIQVRGPKVGSVIMSIPSNATSVAAGGNVKFSAFVAGQAPNQGLTYSVGSTDNGTGAVAAGTAIAADGTLTVSANETASSLYVRAVSNSDETKFDTKEIKIVTVTSVTVTAEGGAARVVRGNRLKFNAVVAGNNSPAQGVTWRVSSNAAGTGAVTSGTTIAGDGTLTVAATEAASTLYVTATSTVNTTKSGSITVTIPTVTSVTVSPVNPTIRRGDGQTFTARVQGTGNPGQDVTWKLDGVGGVPSATTITSNGMLIVSPAETLSGLIVTATSVDDPTKSGTSMITIPATPAAVVPATPAPPPATPAPTPQAQAPAPGTYIITGSGTAFTVTRNGATVGTANQPIQTVINDIRTNAAGAACAIQFGNGTAVLDIGTASATFNNTGGTWGALTLSGKITSAIADSNNGTIYINNNTPVTSTADITNTSTNSAAKAVFNFNNSNGTVTISGGTVLSNEGFAIYNSNSGIVTISDGKVTTTTGTGVANYSNGTISISGGEVSATTGRAVSNYSGGAVRISGGKVSASTGSAVSDSRGRITVSGTALVTSATTNTSRGTIELSSSLTGSSVRLEITGGTVENTSTTTGNAIYNNSSGAVRITGGTVRATGTGAYAVYNNSSGAVSISESATVTGRRFTP
jgi:hypothetical protein